MPLIIKDDGILFSSGRGLCANCGIVGINADLELYEGYDGAIYWPGGWNEYNVQYDVNDMAELADEMIRRWTEFKTTLQGEVKCTEL